MSCSLATFPIFRNLSVSFDEERKFTRVFRSRISGKTTPHVFQLSIRVNFDYSHFPRSFRYCGPSALFPRRIKFRVVLCIFSQESRSPSNSTASFSFHFLTIRTSISFTLLLRAILSPKVATKFSGNYPPRESRDRELLVSIPPRYFPVSSTGKGRFSRKETSLPLSLSLLRSRESRYSIRGRTPLDSPSRFHPAHFQLPHFLE